MTTHAMLVIYANRASQTISRKSEMLFVRGMSTLGALVLATGLTTCRR